MCKTAPQKMRNRIVKECAGLKCSVTSAVKKRYGSANRLPMTKMGIFHLFEETLREARSGKEDMPKKRRQVILDVFDRQSMQVFCAASTKNEIDGLLHLMKDEAVHINLVDSFCFADSLKEIKEQKAGVILGNINCMSQIAKNRMDLTKLVELSLIHI